MGARIELFFRYLTEYGYYKIILTGLKNTLIIAVCGLLIGIVLGTLVAAVKIASARNRVAKVFSYIGDVYTSVFRGTPIVVQLMIFHFIIFKGTDLSDLLRVVLVLA